MKKPIDMTNAPKVKASDELPKKEAEERRDAILKRMLNTPPKPKKGKGEVKSSQRSRES